MCNVSKEPKIRVSPYGNFFINPQLVTKNQVTFQIPIFLYIYFLTNGHRMTRDNFVLVSLVFWRLAATHDLEDRGHYNHALYAIEDKIRGF